MTVNLVAGTLSPVVPSADSGVRRKAGETASDSVFALLLGMIGGVAQTGGILPEQPVTLPGTSESPAAAVMGVVGDPLPTLPSVLLVPGAANVPVSPQAAELPGEAAPPGLMVPTQSLMVPTQDLPLSPDGASKAQSLVSGGLVTPAVGSGNQREADEPAPAQATEPHPPGLVTFIGPPGSYEGMASVRQESFVEAPDGHKTEDPPQTRSGFPTDVELGVLVPPPQHSVRDVDSGVTQSAQSPNRIDADQLMETVVRAMAGARPGRYTMTLQLHPQHLGEVKLLLHLTGREVQTVLQVANPEAKQLLEVKVDQLRHGLEQSGLTLSGFNVSTGDGRQTQRDSNEALEEAVRVRRRGLSVRTATQGGSTVTRVTTQGRQGGHLDKMA